MKDISLKELLEAGCHFGHKVSRWHPKASEFIYQAREGIHIIDLAKTKAGLMAAAQFVKDLGQEGKVLLVVATKRQAKGVVSDAAKKFNIHYLTSRWVGGLITNWEEVKKNISKVNTMRKESVEGAWKKFPKHEQVKLEKELRKLELVYAGVSGLTGLPDAVFIVDVKNEDNCLKETVRKNIPVLAIVDTNADPRAVEYAIPANDDAVGSIQCIVNFIVESYQEGREIRIKAEGKAAEKAQSPNIKDQKEESGIDEVKSEKSKVESEKKPVKSEKKEVEDEKKKPVKEVKSKPGKEAKTVKKEVKAPEKKKVQKEKEAKEESVPKKKPGRPKKKV